MATAAGRIREFVEAGHPRQVITANLDFLRLSTGDQSFRELVNSADLVVPDGMPLIWASGLLGNPLPQRVAGVDLVRECVRVAAANEFSVFMLGAAPGVAQRAAVVLRSECPSLRIAGIHSPRGQDGDENERTLELIQAAEPDMLFVAFGAPAQDRWIRRHMHQLGVPVNIGVGGTFDLLSGRISRAPAWMQDTGFEWFYRFLMEPGRLGRRYFGKDLPLFFRLMAECAFGYPTATASTPETIMRGPAVETIDVSRAMRAHGEDAVPASAGVA